ncbi:MAG: glycosyltransferase family 9 protein [Saprospiraceae bacterium]|nr:glycosyltransferase family 9 protein [Saprospiraceae bacterium]
MKVLVVRFSSIGDIVLTSPIVRALKLQLDAEVHFITKKKFLGVVDQNERIDKVYTIDKEITEILSELKNEAYDIVVDLHKNLRSKRLIFSLGVPSYSFDKINVEKWLRVHTRLNFLPEKHLVDRYYEGMQKLGIEDDGNGLEFFHGLSKKEVEDILPSENFIALVLGATYYTKRIPKEKIALIIEKATLPIVFLGGQDVADFAQELEGEFPKVINLANKLSLRQSAALVANSRFTITGDTGLMHIAAAFKVPTMVFWGSTAHELGMYPYYGKKNSVPSVDIVNTNITCSPCSKIGKKTCPKGHFKCMLGTEDEDVIDGLNYLSNI